MTDTAILKCIDCAHIILPRHSLAQCGHEFATLETADGMTIQQSTMTMRTALFPCGPDGKLFQRKGASNENQ